MSSDDFKKPISRRQENRLIADLMFNWNWRTNHALVAACLITCSFAAAAFWSNQPGIKTAKGADVLELVRKTEGHPDARGILANAVLKQNGFGFSVETLSDLNRRVDASVAADAVHNEMAIKDLKNVSHELRDGACEGMISAYRGLKMEIPAEALKTCMEPASNAGGSENQGK
jgi:hypothetical protein